MDKETKEFKENVNAWIQQIRSEYSQIIDYGKEVEENIGNIQHNYELISELKEEIDDLKESIMLIMDTTNDLIKDEKTNTPRTIH